MKTGDAIRKRITELGTEREMGEYRLVRKTFPAPFTAKSVLQSRSRVLQTDTAAIICAGLGITVQELYNSPLFEDLDTAEEDASERE